VCCSSLQAQNRYAESVKDLHQLTTVDPDNAIAKRELAEVKQLWERQLRDLQARTTKKDTRAERRSKSKSARKSSANEDPEKSPAANLQNIQKLLEELKTSKEKMEELSKMMPSGPAGPRPEQPSKPSSAGKRPSPTTKTPPTASPVPPTAKGGSPTHGRSASKSKSKKASKKPSKAQTKSEDTKPSPEIPLKESKTTERTDAKQKSPPVNQEGGRKGKRITVQEANSSGEEDKPAETTPLPVTPTTQEDNEPSAQDSPTPLVSYSDTCYCDLSVCVIVISVYITEDTIRVCPGMERHSSHCQELRVC